MAQPSDWPPNPFWDFSLAVYRQPGVADACLALQETLGLDVNLLLYVAWRGYAAGDEMPSSAVAEVIARVAPWHDRVVRGLRALRTAMKGDAMAAPPAMAERLRAEIKADELEAERIEQHILMNLRPAVAPTSCASIETARHNIGAYFTALKINAESLQWSAAEVILDAVGKVKIA